MKKLVINLMLISALFFMGCQSTQSEGSNPINRSMLIDSGFNFEIGGL